MCTQWPAFAARLEELAQQQGLSVEEAQDCVQDLALRLVQRFPDILSRPLTGDEQFLLRRCLQNQICNTQRASLRRQNRDSLALERLEEDRRAGTAQSNDPYWNPPYVVIQAEFWQRIAAAAAHLHPLPRYLIFQFYLHDASILCLAMRNHSAQPKRQNQYFAASIWQILKYVK